jgi:hypothetical protein
VCFVESSQRILSISPRHTQTNIKHTRLGPDCARARRQVMAKPRVAACAPEAACACCEHRLFGSETICKF